MSDNEELAGWLCVQLDIDEKIARAASPGPWDAAHGSSGSGVYIHMDGIVADLVMDNHQNDAEHIGRHDPSRVIREVEAKRRISRRHVPMKDNIAEKLGFDASDMCGRCAETWPCSDIRDLASVYADRPGYRPEWVP